MAITTANTIKFSDVCLELYGSSDTLNKTLLGAHADANVTYFHPNYAVAGNTLLDFRGYGSSLAWRAIDQYCVQDEGWQLILKTNSSRSNWCLNRFRLFFPDANTRVQARKQDGTLISDQLFRDPNYTSWNFNGTGAAPTYDHTFMFDLSFNTTNEEIEIYIKGIPVGNKFQQIYAVDAHAGTAVRYREDPNATGYTSTNGADLTYINMGVLRFDQNDAYNYIEHQNLTSIGSPYDFYGRILDVSYNNLTSTDIDQLITGVDANGVQPSNQGGSACKLIIDVGLRTSASQSAWNSLLTKGWTLTEI